MARDAGTRNLTPWEFLNISGCPLGSGCVARRVIKVVIAQFAFYTAANAVSLEGDTWTGCIFHEPPVAFCAFPYLNYWVPNDHFWAEDTWGRASPS